MEDETTLFLSDSFADGRGSGCLECRCRVLNINRGHNEKMVGRCHRLWEYSEFVSEVQERIRQGNKTEDAIHLAMDYCIEHEILRDILIRQRTEVLHMLLTEFDEKKYKRTIYKEGYEDGQQAGFTEGKQAGFTEGQLAGENKKLISLVKKKLKKGKTTEQIAAELEETADTIEEIIKSID